jgi:hypothetical protein
MISSEVRNYIGSSTAFDLMKFKIALGKKVNEMDVAKHDRLDVYSVFVFSMVKKIESTA